MPDRAEFQTLADKRLNEAKTLLAGNCYDAAFYLAGYAVECGLKAAVCKTLQIDVFNMPTDLHKGFKTHRLDHLILLSGLSKQLARDAASALTPALAVAQDQFVKAPSDTANWASWSEDVRYNVKECTEPLCREFINNVEQFLIWLRIHW